MGQTKHYDREYKEEAIKLAEEKGCKKASEELGISYYTLYDWIIVELIKNVIMPDMIKNGITPKIDREHLIGHCEINPITRAFCPGKNFPYDEIISRVNGTPISVKNDDKSKSVNYIMQACSLAAIRNKSSKSGKLLGRVAKGKYYVIDTVTKNNSEIWLKYKDNNTYSMYKDGGNLFNRVGTYKEYVTTARVNVRKQPSISGNKIVVLSCGSTVVAFDEETVSADNYAWQKVLINNDIGYIAKQYLEEK